MRAVFLRRFIRSAVPFLSLCASPLAFACPPGQHEVCMVTCFCVPGSKEDMGAIYDSMGRMAASALEQWIVTSRNNLAQGDVQPIPLHIRVQLDGYYDLRVLETARYKVGDDEVLNAANTMLQNPDVNAVALMDVIVFRHADDAQNNVALWAHELMHVQQYLEWGVSEFAARYTRDYNAVEAPAYEIQRRVTRALKAEPAPAAAAR